MSKRNSLRRDTSGAISTLRWVGIMLSVIVGLLYRRRYLPSPALTSSATVTPTPGEILSQPTPKGSISVPPIGSPSSRLGQAVQVGLPAPNFTLPDLNGYLISLISFRGSVVLINFWTTWCPPCKEEMPVLQEAYITYRDKDFEVLAVNWTQQDDPEQVEPYVRGLGLTFPILLDENGEVSEGLYNLLGLPTSVFVDRVGSVREIYIGPLQLDSIDVKIQTLVEEPL